MPSVSLREVEKRLDRLANVLGLKPWESSRLSPAELLALGGGRQEDWNRWCELAAWMVVMFTSVVPKLGKGRDWRHDFDTLPEFLEQNTPPGYSKNDQEKTA